MYRRLLTPDERAEAARIGAVESWANTADRPARTAAARAAFLSSFERHVDPDGTLSDDERAVLAVLARRAHFQELARRSAEARALKAAARRAGGSR